MTKKYQLKTTAIKSESGKSYKKVYYLNKTKNGNTRVINTRPKENTIRRRRECTECLTRFSSYEKMDIDSIPEYVRGKYHENIFSTSD